MIKEYAPSTLLRVQAVSNENPAAAAQAHAKSGNLSLFAVEVRHQEKPHLCTCIMHLGQI